MTETNECANCRALRAENAKLKRQLAEALVVRRSASPSDSTDPRLLQADIERRRMPPFRPNGPQAGS